MLFPLHHLDSLAEGTTIFSIFTRAAPKSPEISLPTLGRRCGVSSSTVLTRHTRCAALQKSKQRFGRPTAFKIVQGVEQDPPDDPEAHGAALSHGVEGRVPENVERAVIERN
jgi:hypothetical protein